MIETMLNILLTISGIFYAILCVFSIVTGLMYAFGCRELNPIELSDKFMSRYSDPEQLRRLLPYLKEIDVFPLSAPFRSDSNNIMKRNLSL